MSQYGWNDCPNAARRQIDRLVTGFQSILRENLTGVYLHGSLALGCFNPLRSDIDVLAITRQGMDVETKRRIGELLLRVSDHPNAVEISFMQQSDIVPWQYPTPFDFHYGEDWRDELIGQLESGAWRQWNDIRPQDPDLAAHITVTNHRGLRLIGPSIADIFPPVPCADYLDSLRLDVLSDKFGLTSDTAPPVYVVLNGCRTYAYLVDGQILSKDEGGVWALHHLPAAYQTIQTALHAYRHAGADDALDWAGVCALAGYLREHIEPLLTAGLSEDV